MIVCGRLILQINFDEILSDSLKYLIIVLTKGKKYCILKIHGGNSNYELANLEKGIKKEEDFYAVFCRCCIFFASGNRHCICGR